MVVFLLWHVQNNFWQILPQSTQYQVVMHKRLENKLMDVLGNINNFWNFILSHSFGHSYFMSVISEVGTSPMRNEKNMWVVNNVLNRKKKNVW